MLVLTQLVSVFAVISKEVFFEQQPSVTSTPRTLLIHDGRDFKKSHSKLVAALTGRGHTVTYEKVDAAKLPLMRFGELVYDNVILFTPESAFPRKARLTKKTRSTKEDVNDPSNTKIGSTTNLAMKDLLEFIDNGGNVFVGTSQVVGTDIRKLANECGVDIGVEGSCVVDHLHKHAKDSNHTLVYADAIRPDNFPVTGNVDGQKVLHRGIPQHIGPGSLAFSVLTASPTGYSFAQKEGMIGTHTEVNLASAMQARNGGRALFASVDMCSDELIGLSEENHKFCSEVTKWAFREKSVLRWDNLTSHKVGEEHIGTPYMYRMKDDIVFKIDIQQYADGKWTPYDAPDVQLEFVMLDPYIRTFLDVPTTGSTFSKVFKTPDRYGIFKFKVFYKRRGYNQVHVEHLAPLRNYKHNDYDRFLWVAYPYYSVCIITPICVVIVAFLFLYHRESSQQRVLNAGDH